MYAFSSWVLRRAGWIALVGSLLAGIGGYYSVFLYKNLRTDLEELLPQTARSVVDLNEVVTRLESVDSLQVLITCEDTKASKRFVQDLAKKLEAAPPGTIASVEYKIDTELKFFNDRRSLYIELPDLMRIRDYIRDRITYEKQLYNPLNIFSGIELPEPQLDLVGLERKYNQQASAYAHFPEGYYATPDGKKRVVIANLPGKVSGMAGIHRLKSYVAKSVEELNPQSYHKDMVVLFTGGVQNTIEEQEALMEDLGISSVIVLLAVSLGLLVYFRVFRATMCLLISLFMGVAWTFGTSYYAVGYLNANSAFLGSIIIGNGINFGIILLARYLEERRRGRGNHRAIRIAMKHTATATWTAALAAGLSYGSLVLTSFRGFKQFGIIGLIGMVLCWISSFTLLPAFLTLMDSRRPLVSPKRPKPKSYLAAFVANMVSRFPGTIWSISFGMTLVALAMFARYSPDIIETNLGKLRNKVSMERGSGFLSRYVDEIFQRYLSPMVLLPHERTDTREVEKRLKERKASQGVKTMIASVQSLDDFVPKDQAKKIEVLRDIQRILPPRLLKRLSPEDRAKLDTFLKPESFKEIRSEDLPKLVLDKFTEKNGTIGKLVVVEPPLSQDTLNGRALIGFVRELRDVADSVGPNIPVAGPLAISADMIESISRDGPKATLFAFLAVVFLVIFLFRNMKTISLILFSLVLGVVWLGGVILGFQIKVNFLNFIALPITFGIGVDYGVNIFERYREEGSGSILRVIRETGGAVGLCSYTTMVGYGSLLLAANQAFVSFGLFAVLGELTCVVAAIISLPSYLLLRDRKKNKATATMLS